MTTLKEVLQTCSLGEMPKVLCAYTVGRAKSPIGRVSQVNEDRIGVDFGIGYLSWFYQDGAPDKVSERRRHDRKFMADLTLVKVVGPKPPTNCLFPDTLLPDIMAIFKNPEYVTLSEDRWELVRNHITTRLQKSGFGWVPVFQGLPNNDPKRLLIVRNTEGKTYLATYERGHFSADVGSQVGMIGIVLMYKYVE